MVWLKELDLNNAAEVSMMYYVRKSPQVDKWLAGNPPETYFEHVKYLNDKYTFKKFFCIYNETTAIGYCQMDYDPEIELGWALAASYQGFGYGACAVELLVDYAKKYRQETMINKPITLVVKEDNVRAYSLYKRNGFVDVKRENGLVKMELKNE